MIKVLVRHQGNPHMPTIREGIKMTVDTFKKYGVDIDFTLRESNLTLTSQTWENIVFINPANFMVSEPFDIVCLIYDWSNVKPRPTNPVQNSLLHNNRTTPIQIPIQWFTDTTVTPHRNYPSVLHHYMVHEVLHALYFLANTRLNAGLKDEVHNNLSIEWYETIIQKLVPTIKRLYVTDQPKPVSAPQRRNIGLGAVGALVVEAQRLLGIDDDGIFGNDTRDAVLAFQRKNNIRQSGVIGPLTWTALLNQESFVLVRENTNSKQTTGTLTIKKNGATFSCKTLELGWNNNQRNISSIPLGEYPVVWSFSPRFRRFTYEIKNVPNRDGIRIHSANYFHQLNGCIALGDNLVDINRDGQLDTTNSRKTIASFEAFMGKKPFTLKII